MAICARCCLHKLLRIVNLVMLTFGIGMIIYSLWLEKKWNEGVSELSGSSFIPTPWFIFTCSGLGIAVCLSTLAGHIIANCMNNSTICIYIVAFCCLILFEGYVVVMIFFRIDWESEIAAYIDETHKLFERFVMFHVTMCRWIIVPVVLAQTIVVVVAFLLWAVGTESSTIYCNVPVEHRFTQSFLVPASPEPGSSRQVCTRCEMLRGQNNTQPSYLTRIKSLLRWRFHRTNTDTTS